jgi:hypothetical protein
MKSTHNGSQAELESRKAPLGGNMSDADYRISGGGTVYIITPQNTAARENLEAGLSDEAQHFGGGVAVEHRYIGPLVNQLRNEGWVVA